MSSLGKPRSTEAEEQRPEAAEEIDTGEPIPLLAHLEGGDASGFLARLGRRIDRRSLGSQFVELGWRGPVLVLLEWIGALFQIGKGRRDHEGE